MSPYLTLFRKGAAALATAAALLIMTGEVVAGAHHWANPVSGLFTNNFDWAELQPPATGDDALFTVVGPYTVGFTGSVTNLSLQVSMGNVLFESSGSLYTYHLTGTAGVDVWNGSLRVGTGSPLDLVADEMLSVSSADLYVSYGSHVSAARMWLGCSGGTGRITVQGSGSKLSLTGADIGSYIGLAGATGELIVQAGATCDVAGWLNLVLSGNENTKAKILVQGNSSLTMGHLSAGEGGMAGQSAEITVTDPGSIITQNGASALYLGAAANSTTTLNITNSGTFTGGTGRTTLYKTGKVAINGGTFNAKGDILVDGGVLERKGGGVFAWDSGKALTIQNGGRATFSGPFGFPASAAVLIKDPDSLLEGDDSIVIAGGSEVQVTSGGALSAGTSLDVGTSTGGNGTLIVDNASVGAGPTLASTWGNGGATATVAFSNKAKGLLAGHVSVVGNDIAGTTATVMVEGGSEVTFGGLDINVVGGATTGTVTVTGDGSVVSLTAPGSLTVGHGSTGTATLNINDSGTVNTSAGPTTVRKTGRINVGDATTGGTFNVNGDLLVDGGTVNVAVLGEMNQAAGNLTTVQTGGKIIIVTAGDFALAPGATLVITDAGSKVDAGGNVDINNGAQISVTKGGQLLAGGMLVMGPPGGWLSVTEGGHVSVHGARLSGISEGGSGLSIEGAGSTFTTNNQDVDIGYTGGATLVVSPGGTATSGDAYLGRLASGYGAATVDGAASLWDLGTHNLYVGYAGMGSLLVTGGGRVVCKNAFITCSEGASGSAEVNGLDSTWDLSGNLTIGTAHSPGSLATSDLGAVTVAGNLDLKAGGNVKLMGGSLTVGTLGGAGQLNFKSGTLRTTVGGIGIGAGQPLGNNIYLGQGDVFDIAATTSIAAGSWLMVDGGSITSGNIVNDGTMEVHTGSSATTVSGLTNRFSLTLAGGTIAGGLLTNDYGATMHACGTVAAALENDGSIRLDGPLTVSGLITNYGPMTASDQSTANLRQNGGVDNYGTIDLASRWTVGSETVIYGGAITGSGKIVNCPGGVLRGLTGVSSDLENRGGLIHANLPGTVLLKHFDGNLSGGQLRIADKAGMNILTDFTNDGVVFLAGPDSSLSGGAITNTGTIVGNGWIANRVSNEGVILAMVLSTQPTGPYELILTGAGCTNDAGARIEAPENTAILFTQGLAANAGTIALDGGTFDNNARPMTNTGILSGHGTFRTGTLTNAAAGAIRVADHPTLFYGPLVNSGLVQVFSCTTSFFDHVTNDASGTIKNTSGTIRFLGGFTNSGGYTSDPADNCFTDLTNTATGYLAGGQGDRFIISGSLVNDSTRTDAWDTGSAEVRFTGGAAHTMAVSGPVGAFRWGTLAVEAGNMVNLSGSSATATCTANSGTINQTVGIADLGRIVGPGNLSVGSGATMNALSFRGAGRVDVAGLLAIGADRSTSTTKALRLAESGGLATGTLDIGTGSLAIDYSAGALSPLSQVKSWIQQGYNNMTWTGKGITSSAAALHPITNGVGYTQNDMLFAPYQVFSGEPVDLSTVLVKFTYAGDVNLDGAVDDNDVSIIGLFYDNGGTSSHYWNQGDIFGYDGRIDDNDVSIIGLTYGLGIGAPLGGGPVGAVPEPATLALLALGGLAAAMRRKRSA